MVPYFGTPGAEDRWRAVKIYSTHAIAAPGLGVINPPPVVAADAQLQFDRALGGGLVQAFADNGSGDFPPLNPANFLTRKIGPGSTVVIGDAARAVFFEARQVQAFWPVESPSVADRIDKERQVEAVLRDILAGPRPSGMNKKKLWEGVQPRIPWKAFDEMFRRLAKELRSPWNRAGRPQKSRL
jgi:hypothetical protein